MKENIMAKRKAPPFSFKSYADAHKDGKLKSGCRTIKVQGKNRYLCKIR